MWYGLQLTAGCHICTESKGHFTQITQVKAHFAAYFLVGLRQKALQFYVSRFSDICIARSPSVQSPGLSLSSRVVFNSGAKAGHRHWKISGVIDIYCIRVSCTPESHSVLGVFKEEKNNLTIIQPNTYWPGEGSGGSVCSEKDKERLARRSLFCQQTWYNSNTLW